LPEDYAAAHTKITLLGALESLFSVIYQMSYYQLSLGFAYF